MKTRKTKIIRIVTVILIVIASFLLGKSSSKEESYFEDELEQIKSEQTLSMMIEQTAGAGDYKMETRTSWPTDGYKFNATLSKCENGGELGWDDTNKVVTMTGNMSDKCYVYFDIYVPPKDVSDVCSGGETLSSCVITLSQESSPSYTNIYYHNSSLTNGADDNSYRYAGGEYQLTNKATDFGLTLLYTSDSTSTNGVINFYCNGSRSYVGNMCSNGYFTLQYDSTNTQYSTLKDAIEKGISDGYLTRDNVNNYVCFGSDDATCPENNLYRIIGVFGDQVKLIKADYANSNLLGTGGGYTSSTSAKSSYSGYTGSFTTVNEYKWNSSAKNTWSTSLLNKTNLNTNYITYLNNINTKWANMIETTTWKVGGNTGSNIITVVPKTAYTNEITSPVTTNTTDSATIYSAKIGLMYVSDYGFAASSSAWSTALTSYNSYISINWMYLGMYEWTISRMSDYSSFVFLVYWDGSFTANGVSEDFVVRPVFYLKSSVTYSSGSGTSSDPIRLGA